MVALRLQSVFPFGEWSGIGAIPVVRDCSGFATRQWLIERSWSCRHSVYMCYRTMQIIDMAGGYRLPWTFPGRQYGTSGNTDRNRSPGDLSVLPFHRFHKGI